MEHRTEKDFLGHKQVPQDAYFGIHTQRSVEHFSFSGKKPPKICIHKMFEIKKACAKANLELRLLDQKKAHAIFKACDEALTGKFDAEFPIGLFQAGSATSTHMNVNEVIANRATELLDGKKGEYLVHPNDDVNKGQSTNDVVPTAVKMGNLELAEKLEKALEELSKELERKAKEFHDVVKTGRTHLQDAVPITLGQEFGAYAACTKKHLHKIKHAKSFLLELALGGNAIGTGINTLPAFRAKAIGNLSKQTGKKFHKAENGMEQVQFFSDVNAFSAAVSGLAADLNKISNDLRLLASGPTAGFAEITLPPVEPGSSIMPGKINPSMLEAINMACVQAMANHFAVTTASASGQLELNTFMPLIAYMSIESIELMESSCRALAWTVKGTKANKEKCLEYAEKNPSIATALNPVIGYEKASEVVKEALKTGKTIKQVTVEKGLLTKSEADKLLDAKRLAKA